MEDRYIFSNDVILGDTDTMELCALQVRNEQPSATGTVWYTPNPNQPGTGCQAFFGNSVKEAVNGGWACLMNGKKYKLFLRTLGLFTNLMITF